MLEVLLFFQLPLRMGGAAGGGGGGWLTILGVDSYTSHSNVTLEPQNRFLWSGAVISYSERFRDIFNDANSLYQSDNGGKINQTCFFSIFFPLFVTPGDAFP